MRIYSFMHEKQFYKWFSNITSNYNYKILNLKNFTQRTMRNSNSRGNSFPYPKTNPPRQRIHKIAWWKLKSLQKLTIRSRSIPHNTNFPLQAHLQSREFSHRRAPMYRRSKFQGRILISIFRKIWHKARLSMLKKAYNSWKRRWIVLGWVAKRCQVQGKVHKIFHSK